MKLYAPKYYNTFKCIAEKCRHSCCIGWEIDIDGDTLKKYEKLTGGYGKAIMDSILVEDTPHFKLCEGEKCPHLDERGLCKIILNLGESYLSDICREHPRFYNFTDVAEVGLGMSCPTAAALILSSPDYAVIEEIGEVDAKADGDPFNGRKERSKIYDFLQDGSRSYASALKEIYVRYSADVGEDGSHTALLSSLEYLNAEHKELFAQYSPCRRPEGKEAEEYLKRFLAYLVYRHCTEAFDRDDFCCRLSFCLFCERLLASLVCYRKARTLSEFAELCSIISEEIEYSDENTEMLTYGNEI